MNQIVTAIHTNDRNKIKMRVVVLLSIHKQKTSWSYVITSTLSIERVSMIVAICVNSYISSLLLRIALKTNQKIKFVADWRWGAVQVGARAQLRRRKQLPLTSCARPQRWGASIKCCFAFSDVLIGF
jgi:hypothetical protein